jgi:hypothetical protein
MNGWRPPGEKARAELGQWPPEILELERYLLDLDIRAEFVCNPLRAAELRQAASRVAARIEMLKAATMAAEVA